MKLHELKPAEGSRKVRNRVGRGTSSGNGKTAGRGQKGQKARSGGKVRLCCGPDVVGVSVMVVSGSFTSSNTPNRIRQ